MTNHLTALESILAICNETREARDLQPRLTEIRSIAREALAKADATTSTESEAPGVERVCSTCRHEALSESEGACAGCGYVAAYDRWEPVALAARPVAQADAGAQS